MSQDIKPNHRILIVDDNTSIHEDFREILAHDHSADTVVTRLEEVLFDGEQAAPVPTCFELSSAYQGHEGLELVKQALAQERPYALAFVDVRMPPGWDGIETIARIWEVDPQIQIVVCTAYADYSWEQMRAKVGQPDGLLVLKKPFDNIEVQQLAHALTRKWLLNAQADQHLTDLSQANELLTLSEERFSNAFHHSPLPSALQSLSDQRFLDANQRFAELSGYNRQDLIGRTAFELRLWEQPAAAAHWYQRLAKQELVREQEAVIHHRTAGGREVRISLSAVTLGGQPHALLLAQDVSERALLERQLRQAQKMEAIGQLAAGVAHDFNNILTVIQGHAGLMQHTLAATAPQRKSLQEIANAAGRASTLIRQLLMFSRKQVMQFKPLDLNATLRKTLEMLQRLVGEHVEINFEPHESLPCVDADASMLEQIIMNFAVNSRDAMPEGGRVFIGTSLKEIERPPTPSDPERRSGKHVCLTFRDNGKGMDTQTLSRIFEPFFTTKPPGKGTGLGLSTVFGIVRQHHGWVEVDSKPGQGTTFQVFLPPGSQMAHMSEPVAETTLKSGRETVLVAEDENALREMVVEVLKLQGYTVLEASSGRDALQVWEQTGRRVDLLLTDMVMPGGMTGSELAAQLLKRSPQLKVIYTSGYSDGMAGKDVSLLEGRDFLSKPYSVGKLAQLVRHCLDTPAQTRNHEHAKAPNACALAGR
jgi:PAS domain S-box-containing protein